MASRDIHGLFGLKAPAPPQSGWHDRMRVRYEIRQLPPQPSISLTRVQVILGGAALFLSLALLVAVGRAPVPVTDATYVIMGVLGTVSLIVGYPVGCSIFLKLRPITPGQIAAFAELSPPEVWRRACVEIDKEMRSSLEPMTFDGVRFHVAAAATRLAAETLRGNAREPRQQQIQAFQALRQSEVVEP